VTDRVRWLLLSCERWLSDIGRGTWGMKEREKDGKRK